MPSINIRNIFEHEGWFQVLQTSKNSQTAVMVLGPGKASGEKPEDHEHSEQTLLLVEGELEAEIGTEHTRMKSGDVVVIPPGTKHRFKNPGPTAATTFSVYCPPEY